MVKNVDEVDVKFIQDYVGGCFDITRIDKNNVCYVNDEGLLEEENYFFSIDGKVLAGNGIIMGDDGAGNECDSDILIDGLIPRIKFLGKGVRND
jgi:hypothetical protein